MLTIKLKNKKTQLPQGFFADCSVVNRVDNCVNEFDKVANILEKE